MDVTDKIRPWMKECRLCPRNCGADRMAGQKGFCGTDTEIMVCLLYTSDAADEL